MNQQPTSRPLTGKTAIVTGASRGIGAAIALRLAQLGANVTIDYLSNNERAQQTAQHIEHDAAALGRIIVCKADVTDLDQVNELTQTTANTFGSIDILINNALSHYSFDPRNRSTFDNTDWNDYAIQLEGCLKGTYNTCTATLPYMLVDSPIVPYHDYIAAKGALIGLTRSLAQEAGAWGITVNAIAAGLTVGTDSSRATTEDIREHIIEQTPLGRLATADDIAGGVAMLVGEDARFITGQTLHVDGGLTMR